MIFNEFLKELEEKGISLSYSEGKIRYQGPEQNIDPQFIENLKKYRGKLVKHLWPQECNNMMPINPQGNKIPFILLHGEKMNYPLSEYFGDDQPFYGFFHYGSQGEKIFHKEVKDFAKDYINQLQKVVPKGPYYLAGFSFGGLIAFEMAVQLQEQGFDVPVLILIDCKNPMFKEPVNAPNKLSKLSQQLYNFSKEIYYSFYHKTRNLYFEFYLLINSTLHHSRRNYYIMSTYMDIGKRYRPNIRYNGEILLFKSSQNNSAHEFLGWENLCNRVEIVIVEGNHHTIYESNESYLVLSKKMGDWLQKTNEKLLNYSSLIGK